ncbi:fatty acyl-CoA reductase wat-like [Cataglyphis hispanica]|uniref:fatty acyl-CoA reductase wat-like n=1 Tax=Cataglyphis hispanica TaxID=1086592 RepID=UPI00217F65F3|nr:fatty acyl-CoA reductase wat-like [Cataglyphis hispanica]
MAQRKNYIEEMLNMSDLSTKDSNDYQSEIPQFFAGCKVFVTGASGFLGILLIEKLLRCCPDIEKIYILMRAKKEKSSEVRFKEHFNNPVYDRLKEEQPNFGIKVIMIEGDVGKLDLGLSPENRKLILDTNIIFHGAATVRFNETIRTAVNINVRGTKQMLLLAKEMPNFKAFIYTSTAFSHCIYHFIEEKFYPPPIETDKILTLLDILNDEQLEKLTPALIGKWPNTYAYTKAIAEDTVRQYSTAIPVCIVRPSIIISTAKEPIPGWINNVYGAMGVVVGAAMGLLRTLYCPPDNVAELVPADYVISHLIVASWDLAKKKNDLLSIENANPEIPETERVPIYNYVSICQNPITWGRFMNLNKIYGMQVVSTHVVWYHMLVLNKYKFVHDVCVIFLHKIPAIIVDILLFLSGRKPMLRKAYAKIDKFSNVIMYFSSQQWRFCNDAVINLWERMNPADREIFNFNIDDLDWESCLKHMIPGICVYLFNDPLEIIEKERVKYSKLKVAYYTLITVISILLILSLIFRLIQLL